MSEPALKAPFPAFGGKSRVADLVWSRIGDVSNYIEPFFNSGAVLLRRPHPPKIETANDLDANIANFWRATKHDPEAVVDYADGPVSEIDLHARHRWLVLGEGAAEFRRRMRDDPEYYDPKRAGWWCWGACCWIGAGWCTDWGSTADGGRKQSMPYIRGTGGGMGVTSKTIDLPAQLPHLGQPNDHGGGGTGRGVHAKGPSEKRPGIGNSRGVHNLGIGPSDRHCPPPADADAPGRGVHAGAGLSERLPLIGGGDHQYGHGIHAGAPVTLGTCAARRQWLLDWFGRLRDRLRTVRVCCGDWKRVCGSPSTTTRLGLTGIFLDAPYKHTLADGSANRSADLYGNDRTQDVNGLVDDVIAYCVERGADPLMRIVAASYEGEGYEVLLDHGWECIEWRSSGGYGNRSARGKANAWRERLWVSPYCERPGFRRRDDLSGQRYLFDPMAREG